MKGESAPGGDVSVPDFQVEIQSGGRGQDKGQEPLIGEPKGSARAARSAGRASAKEHPNNTLEAHAPQTSPMIRRKTVLVAGGLVVIALGLFFWNNASEGGARLETPGQGHPHTATILRVPGSEDAALWLGTHDGLYLKYLSPRAPAGWGKMGAPLSGTDVMAISSAKTTSSPIYVAGHNIGVQRSDDGGLKWRQIVPGAPARDVHALAVDPLNADRVYIWAEVVGMLASSNGGATWETLGKGETLKNPLQVTALAVGRAVGATMPVLFAGTNMGLYSSADGGETWKPSHGPATDELIYALLVINGPQSSEVYAGTATTALYSADAGATWRKLEGASELGGIGGLAMDASSGPPGRLLAVNGANQLFASDDGGQTWNLLP